MKSVTKEKVFHVLKMVLLAVTVTLVLLSLLGTVAHASGLVDDTVNADNLYSKYPLSNYQLDFYVDNSWSWLPWNWLDGIGKSVQYGLYCITNFVWTISLYLSNATGYVVQQAYKLDFINDMADSIGKSIQTLAGVTENGFSSSGFYVGFLLIIILIVGVYTAYGESDIETLGADRVESLLSASPDTDDREDVVVDEIEDRDNANLSVTKTMSRLGTVVFLFIFNIGISIFVFLLTGMMIFSQVLFIIYAMFLPVSFILSMIPTYEGMAKKALTKLFNTIMLRAGITLIITTAFSISTMFYSISSGYPFFMVAFLQIVTFAGIYMKLGDLMSMFSLQANDTQQVGRRIMRRPYMFLNRRARRLERKIGRTVAAGAAGGVAGAAIASNSRKAFLA